MSQAEQAEKQARTLRLVAPIDGVVTPIESVPDPVFSQKIMGEGVSIDPTSGTLVAPCAGEVLLLHRAHHALTLGTKEGVQVLLHIGLDTVALAGEGFTPKVKVGDQVVSGQPLIEFDLDLIASKATSALTEMIITEGAGAVRVAMTSGMVQAGVDELLVVNASEEDVDATTGGAVIQTERLRIVNPHGLHARPAARFVKEAKSFDCRITVHKGGEKASATSLSTLMGLDLAHGDEVCLSAEGPQAEAALRQLKALIESGLGEDLNAATSAGPSRFESVEAGVLGGIPAAPGLSIGEVVIRKVSVPEFAQSSGPPDAQLAKLRGCLEEVRSALKSQIDEFTRAGPTDEAQIFGAHAELLEDPALLTDAEIAINQGASAAAAWQSVITRQAAQLSALSNPLMRQRADDIKDVGHRVLLAICGVAFDAPKYDQRTVLVCDELTPSAVAYLPEGGIAAILTREGGATSHAAIIARALGVPYVAGLGDSLAQLEDGQTLIVSGDEGWVRLAPDAQQLKAVEAQIAERAVARAKQLAVAHEPAKTLDGRVIEIAANIGSGKEAEQAVAGGADGVGLLRSEFMFLKRREAPSEDEQREQFERIGQALGEQRSLVVRTLDVGGDKPLSYLPMPSEENPFLGIRGLRLSLRYPEMFTSQIRAALAAAKHTQLHIMFPMVSQLEEFLIAKQQVLLEAHKLRAHVSIGVMVEVPSAALMADAFAQEVDFFSIGTNDLLQYTLAMDRGHAELASQADVFEPAVLRLIRTTTLAAKQSPRKPWVGICGGLAAEPLATPLLVGLGVTELSVPSPAIASLKAAVRTLKFPSCQRLAERALSLPDAPAVRALLEHYSEHPVGISYYPTKGTPA